VIRKSYEVADIPVHPAEVLADPARAAERLTVKRRHPPSKDSTWPVT